MLSMIKLLRSHQMNQRRRRRYLGSSSPRGCLFPPRCNRIGQRVKHQLAPHKRRVYRQVRMALSQTSSRTALSMTGTVLVPQLGNTNGDRRRATENAFDACAIIRPDRRCLGRAKSESFLGAVNQRCDVVVLAVGHTVLVEYQLGCRLNQLLGAADHLFRVIWQCAFDAVEMALDDRGVLQIGQRAWV